MKLIRILLIVISIWCLLRVVLDDAVAADLRDHISSDPRATLAVLAVFVLTVWGVMRTIRRKEEE